MSGSALLDLVSTTTLEQAFAKGAEYEAFVDESAKILAKEAASLAPGSTGQYIFSHGDSVYFRHPTGVWHIIEFGSVNNPAYAPMRRAMTAVGLPHTDASAPIE